MHFASRARAASLCLFVLVACGDPDSPAVPTVQNAPRPPGELRLSEAGLYRVSLRPQREPVPLRQLHAWVARLETADGEPVRPSRFAVSGGMPQHAHGFETEPRVTRDLGGGEFLIEGVRFHMAGAWVMRLEWVGPAGADVALVDVEVEP